MKVTSLGAWLFTGPQHDNYLHKSLKDRCAINPNEAAEKLLNIDSNDRTLMYGKN